MVDGPRAPAGFPSLYTVSRHDNKISGAEDPRAINERLAIVAFQMGFSISTILFVFGSFIFTIYVVDVITSIASMKISAIIEIPRNRYIKKTK